MLKTNSHTGRGRAALALALASLALGGCDSDTTGPDPQAPVAAVEMTPEEMDLVTGDTLTIQALPMAADSTPITGREVAWSSDDTLVVTVSGSGRVRAVAAGITLVRARVGGVDGLTLVRVANPVAEAPVITELSPGSALAGSGAFTLSVKGGVYLPGSTVLWNGEERPTTRVSPNELRADIGAADVADAGTVEVRVEHPPTGGGVSQAAVFQINTPAPAPAVLSLAPAVLPAGSLGFTLVVTGQDLPEGVIAAWAGHARPTERVNDTEVRVEIAAGDIWFPGEVPVRLFHATQGVVGTALFTVAASGIHRVEVDPASLELDPGEEGRLQARLLAADGSELTGRHLTWASSNATVVEVVDGGSYRALEPGTARIRASSADGFAYVDVTVAPHPVAYLRLVPPSPVLVGESVPLQVTVHAAAGQVLEGRTVTWQTENPLVAEVDGAGVVTGIAAGTTRIWAEAEGKRTAVQVEVREWPQPSPWTFDLRWPVGTLQPSVGDTTFVDAGGVERTSALILRDVILTVDMDQGRYVQEFRLTAQGIDGEILRTDSGTVFYNYLDTQLEFWSDLREDYGFVSTFPVRGEMLVLQEIGPLPDQVYRYVVR
ncbi:MAG TPA: Ig-like domain-containing protein [Longimicrobiales bacterium]|nr:Ig-like domain-containing protein [Longimicrobiales bacterium]